MLHKPRAERANLFLIGGGMISAPRPGSIKKVLEVARDECLYAAAPSIEEALKRGGADYELIVGEGMFHCYPVFPIVKEAKEGWRQMMTPPQPRSCWRM